MHVDNAKSFFTVLVATACGALSSARADVKPGPLFTDNAVLQRDASVPVWGKASPGEKVTVRIKGQSATTVTGDDGKWMVRLKPMPAGGPLKMVIAGDNVLTLDNILVGDVWLASGQSNMQYGIANADRAEAEKADDGQLRIFQVPHAATLAPVDTLQSAYELDGRWAVATPQSLTNCPGWGGFSAVGYFFGRELRRHTHQPVGLIGSYWGGTVAQSWTPLNVLKAEPSLRHYADEFEQFAKTTTLSFPFTDQGLQADHAAWEKRIGPNVLAQYQAWKQAAWLAREAHRPEPPQPALSDPEPTDSVYPNHAGVLYNAMITPLVPYAIKGVIWYQGESNNDDSKNYRTLFPALIRGWREQWGQGDFPFLFVQIPPFVGMSPEIREAQFLTLARSVNTAMTVTTDVGDANDIHPKYKRPVGERLALAARALAYGEKVEYSGPLFDKATFEHGNAVVHFKHTGGGLLAKGGDLRGFTVAGTNGKFLPAIATISGTSVVVRADGVADPKAVRFGWANVPDVNLFNKEGLPASPFRSDPD